MTASNLTDEQINQIKLWADQGDQLNDLQKKIVKEFNLNATYMDVRFLIIDLGIELKQEEPAKEEPAPTTPATPTGSVEVSLDEIIRSGFLVSGNVTFSDGVKATWAIDEMGQISLDADQADYQPSEQDMQDFKENLKQKLAP